MKKIKIFFFISIMTAIMLTTGCGSAASNQVKPAPTPVNKNIVEASGVVKASKTENIVLNMPIGYEAKVAKVIVSEGQKVSKGEKLIELDLTGYYSLVSQKNKTISADQYLLKDMQSDNQKNAQNFKIAAEKAELDVIKVNVNKSYISFGNIVSDMDNSVVTDISYSQGDVISVQKKVLSLQDLSSLYIQANVDEEFIKDVAVGKVVTIIPKKDPSAKLTGKVIRISNEAVTQNGDTSVAVEISIDNNNGRLFPNYNVDVEISKK